MKPVNVIKLRRDPSATMDRYWHILIDKKELTDLLEQAVIAPTPRHWSNKNKALVNLVPLQNSLGANGEFDILICANCAMSGFRGCGDLGLKPFVVTQEGGFILWKVQVPHSNPSAEGIPSLEFRFHRPQFESELVKATDVL